MGRVGDPMSDYLIPRRALDDGRVVDVVPLTFGRARVTVSPSLDSGWYDDGW